MHQSHSYYSVLAGNNIIIIYVEDVQKYQFDWLSLHDLNCIHPKKLSEEAHFATAHSVYIHLDQMSGMTILTTTTCVCRLKVSKQKIAFHAGDAFKNKDVCNSLFPSSVFSCPGSSIPDLGHSLTATLEFGHKDKTT